MTKNKKKTPKIQLYHLLREINPYIQNKDDFGSIVSLSIVNGLNGFNTNSGDMNEVHFEEIKDIYSQLGKVIDMCREENKDIYLTLYKSAKPLLDKNKVNSKSKLLERIVKKLNTRRNPDDLIRRTGNLLYENIISRGPYHRPFDYLTNDYSSIEDSFDLEGRVIWD